MHGQDSLCPFNNDRYLFEPVLSGDRLILARHANGYRITNNLGNVVEGVELPTADKLPVDTVLDGVLVCATSVAGKRAQVTVLRRYVAFDLLVFKARSYLNETMINRRIALESLLQTITSNELVAITWGHQYGVNLAHRWQRKGIKALYAKNIDGTYLPGIITPNWLHIQLHQRKRRYWDQRQFAVG